MVWQLIETAPRDGTKFLAIFSTMFDKYEKDGQGCPWCISWFSTSIITGQNRIMIYGIGEFETSELCPTHWIPFPLFK